MASNLIRFGTDSNGSGTSSDMWLPVYGGMVITAFEEHVLFPSLVNTKQIAPGNGDTEKFPATWKMESDYHVAGASILGFDSETREYSISLDDRPLYTAFELDDVDRKMSHFDVSSEYGVQSGRELSQQLDYKIASLLLNASATAQVSGSDFPGGGLDGNGSTLDSASLGTANRAGAIAFLDLLEDGMVRFDEIDIPESERYAVCKPDMWYQIRKLGNWTVGDTTLPGPQFGNADIENRNPQITAPMSRNTPLITPHGLPLYRSNRLPQTNTTGDPKLPAKYQGDWSDVKGLMWHKTAVANLMLEGISVETDRETRQQLDITVTKVHSGGGTLRPYCAIALTQ